MKIQPVHIISLLNDVFLLHYYMKKILFLMVLLQI